MIAKTGASVWLLVAALVFAMSSLAAANDLEQEAAAWRATIREQWLNNLQEMDLQELTTRIDQGPSTLSYDEIAFRVERCHALTTLFVQNDFDTCVQAILEQVAPEQRREAVLRSALLDRRGDLGNVAT